MAASTPTPSLTTPASNNFPGSPGSASHLALRRQHHQHHLHLHHHHRHPRSPPPVDTPPPSSSPHTRYSSDRTYILSHHDTADRCRSFDHDHFCSQLYSRGLRIDKACSLITRGTAVALPSPPPTPPQSRSLLFNCVVDNNAMMTTTTAAPGSPPDLSGSKSSTSSSFHSSSFSNKDGVLSDISHFEDIGLDDDHSSDYAHTPKLERHSVPVRPAHRPPLTATRNSTPVLGPFRDLTGSKRPGYPTLRNQVHGTLAENAALGLPRGAGPRRGFTSPSSPSLPIGMARRNRSISPSTTYSTHFSPSSPGSLPNGTPISRRGTSPVMKPPSRRGSWQPNRKTVKELEEEYNDADDEVPEDAIFWNIPISPRPVDERSPSAVTSARSSPQRDSPLSIAGALEDVSDPLDQTRSAPMVPDDAVSIASTASIHSNPPVRANLPRGASTGDLATKSTFHAHKSRAKSWTAALLQLSEEARSLTEVLEAHAEEEDRKREEKVQNGTARSSSETEKNSNRKTVIELPPLNKFNVMIDPLPISKEKEKVLTRTRPSWLPPKSQKEEKKHLKEYQRMMALSVDSEKRKHAKEIAQQHARDVTKTSLGRIWEQHVIPDWDNVINQHRTRELWWRGVAPRSRAIVWQRGVNNELQLTEASYDAALKRASASKKGAQKDGKEAQWYEAIERDANNTFVELQIFRPDGPLHQPLVDVLMAYSAYRSDVGYVYGTHLIAALLLLNMSAPAAFMTMSNLLNRPIPLAFMTHDSGAISRAYQLTISTLEYKFPRLYNHLITVLQLSPESILEPMFSTLFVAKLDVELVSRVFDVLVFEGDKAIIRTAVAVLGKLESCLYGSREEVLDLLGWNGSVLDASRLGCEDDFISAVRSAGKVEGGQSPRLT